MTIQPSGNGQPVPSTPPGWYQVDPYTDRWWDGHRWTEHARPRQMAVVPVQVPVGPSKSVSRVPVQTNHLLHLVLTILTAGLWAPVWILMTILNSMSRKKVVTRYH